MEPGHVKNDCPRLKRGVEQLAYGDRQFDWRIDRNPRQFEDLELHIEESRPGNVDRLKLIEPSLRRPQ